MGKRQRDKGKRGEYLARDLLRSLGYTDCIRAAQVAAHPDVADSADVIRCIPGVRIEVKFGYDDAELHHALVRGWIETAVRDTPDDEVWMIMWKRTRKPWLVIYEVNETPVAGLDAEAAIKHVAQIATSHT